MHDQLLSRAIAAALHDLDRDGDLVITSPHIEPIADRIAEAALSVVPSTTLSLELLGVRSLILHAISNKQFFDWEMPTLTGFTAAEFERIAEKLPRG
jgi:hypothetical protein